MRDDIKQMAELLNLLFMTFFCNKRSDQQIKMHARYNHVKYKSHSIIYLHYACILPTIKQQACPKRKQYKLY